MAQMFEEQVQAVRRRIQETAAEIRELLTQDLVTYPDREMKRRFLADTGLAEAIDDARLVQLRKEASRMGEELASRLNEALSDDSVWTEAAAPSAPEVRESKDLRDVEPVWRHLAAVDVAFEELAATVGLTHDDRQPPGYAPPRRFIERRYLPTLVEAYTRAASELQMLLQSSAQERAAEKKRSLLARWESAGE